MSKWQPKKQTEMGMQLLSSSPGIQVAEAQMISSNTTAILEIPLLDLPHPGDPLNIIQ